MKRFKRLFGSLLIALLLLVNVVIVEAEEEKKGEVEFNLSEVVVTAPTLSDPLVVTTDPKAPRQPVPPADGGGYLKNIPGFCLIRKGGTGGDPLFRGLGASRLNIQLDNTSLSGGCGGRMDPPTTYVFPEAYDKITFLKGPQSVAYGTSLSGTVLFERKTQPFEEKGTRFFTSSIVGSFGRNDEIIDATHGNKKGYVRIIGTKSHSGNYKDGDGNQVNSFYDRSSITGIFGWTPDTDTLVELTLDSSKAKAAYADRTMDGSKFDRTGYNLKLRKENLSSQVKNVEINLYRNYIDHVMDNYSLRQNSGMKMAMNPDRLTIGGKISTELQLSPNTSLQMGLDYLRNKHTSRNGNSMVNYWDLPRTPDMTFNNLGVFVELTHQADKNSRWLSGLRVDHLTVDDEKTDRKDSNTNYSGFLRYEREKGFLTTYLGLGKSSAQPIGGKGIVFSFFSQKKIHS